MRKKAVVVIGASGHSKVLISTLQAQGFSIKKIYDEDPKKIGTMLLGFKIKALSELPSTDRTPAIIAVGDNQARARLRAQFSQLPWVRAIHPTAHVDRAAKIGVGTLVCAGAVIQPDVVIGAHVIINTGATVDHDCVIGDYAHLAPGSHLSGHVRVEQGALVGIGDVAIPSTCIGAWAVVGAGAAVISDIPPNMTAVGTPAKLIL